MTDPAALLALKERVEKATGADRELDSELMEIEHFRDSQCIGVTDEYYKPVKSDVWVNRKTEKWKTTATQGYEFTASIEASLGLVGRVLPGTMWACGSMEDGPFCRLVIPVKGDGWRYAASSESEGNVAQTPPLAILSALLSALAMEPKP